ncbi:hypothetical protein AVEN_4813-1 [Araneus ventricosus]|uniref:Endonuclease/exonuclease/phosphatase domain-containing protein n=1 Tax=Araneus ventricosus TaxID=182803 RepID=A0A4Y2X738_ARAVE|nr:hypothetical protein AVEN_4813-1 [Araneus ventricosus]
MNQLTHDFDNASSVAQNNQGRARGLGRGLRSTSKLQSPFILKTLKILQCNINGLTTLATRVKVDQLLRMAEANNVQVIALQETKLNMKTTLKYRGYNIYRKGRPTKGGGGLDFFIRNINYESIDSPVDENSDLEIQGIKITWRGKPLHFFNAYRPPNQKQLLVCFPNYIDKNSIIVGHLNAKHSTWGCSSNIGRGLDTLSVC